MTAKAKSIAYGEIDLTLLGLVESEVEGRNLRIISEVVDRWGNNPVLNGEDGCDGLDSTCSTEEMTSHRLSGVDGNLIGIVSKEPHDGFRLRDVADGRRSAVGIDMIDIRHFHARFFHRLTHSTDDTESIRMGGGDMIGVGRETGTSYLCIDMGATGLGMFQLLKDERA